MSRQFQFTITWTEQDILDAIESEGCNISFDEMYDLIYSKIEAMNEWSGCDIAHEFQYLMWEVAGDRPILKDPDAYDPEIPF